MTSGLYPISFNDNGGLFSEEHITIEHAALWERAPPSILVDASGRNLDLSPLKECRHLGTAKSLERLRDAYLVWADKFFVSGEAKCGHIVTQREDLTRIADAPQNEMIYKSSGIRRHKQGLVIDFASLPTPHEVTGRVLFGTADEPANWGLFLLTTIPAAAYFLANRDKYDKFMCFADMDTMKQMLEIVGLNLDDVIFHFPLEPYHFEEVSVFRAPWRELRVPPNSLAIFRDMARRCAKPDAPHKIFATRLALPEDAYRRMENESELAEFMSSIGFTCVEPQLLSAEDQIAMFVGADHIAGTGGAGMFNAVFCRKHSKLLDIESTATFLDGHSSMFSSVGLDYGVIVGAESLDDARPSHKRWSLDLSKTRATITDFFR
jgi:Glycosyltransferase 61